MRIGPISISLNRPDRRNAENPAHGITWEDVFGSKGPGRVVSGETALRISAVLACVRVLAESVGSISWLVYRRLPGGGKARAVEHHTYNLLHSRPNPMMSSIAYRERLMKDLLLRGNHYSLIDYGLYGTIQALWPLNPTNVTPELSADGRSIRYRVRSSSGFDGIYNFEEILHVACLGDGVVGKSVISYNAEAFGLAMALDDFARSFFENGAYAGGVLETDKKIDSKEGRDRLKEGWQQAYGKTVDGMGWHKVAVLEDGLKWKPMTISPKDALALESRQFQVTDIARMFRVSPHLIGDLTHATFSNVEHLSLEHVTFTCLPWLVRIEQESNFKLYGPGERDEIYSEFLVESLLRGDIKTRAEAMQIMRRNGALNADEWRDRENFNPIPEGAGQKFVIEANMQELKKVGDGNAGKATELKAVFDAYGVAVRSGSITPQPEDEEYHRKAAGLPVMSEAVQEAWEADGRVRRPVTLVQNGDDAPQAQPPAPPAGEGTEE